MPATQPATAYVEGVTLWRRIADDLRLEISSGRLPVGARLPGESALALRFGVNRHTVRAALKALERDGLVRAMQGRGTFIAGGERVRLGIPNRERLATGIAGPAGEVSGRLLAAAVEPPTPAIAAALWLHGDELVTRMETVSEVEGRPMARTTSWFSAERFPAIDAIFAELGSISLALRHYEVLDYVRSSSRISGRAADADESRWLELSPGAMVLVSEGIEVERPDGRPIVLSLGRFAADRVELVVLGE